MIASAQCQPLDKAFKVIKDIATVPSTDGTVTYTVPPAAYQVPVTSGLYSILVTGRLVVRQENIAFMLIDLPTSLPTYQPT